MSDDDRIDEYVRQAMRLDADEAALLVDESMRRALSEEIKRRLAESPQPRTLLVRSAMGASVTAVVSVLGNLVEALERMAWRLNMPRAPRAERTMVLPSDVVEQRSPTAARN